MAFTILDFEYTNAHGACIYGQIYLGFEKGIFYKPLQITIQSGYMDCNHNNNYSIGAKEHRDRKNELIKKYTENNKMNTHQKIITSFILKNKHGIGLVSLASILGGYNANRGAKMKINILNKNWEKAGMFFQNLKYNKNISLADEFIPWDQIEKQHYESIKSLINNYKRNNKTSSAIEKEIK